MELVHMIRLFRNGDLKEKHAEAVTIQIYIFRVCSLNIILVFKENCVLNPHQKAHYHIPHSHVKISSQFCSSDFVYLGDAGN